ncbi:MAG: tryptophanase [Candidatus Heimdallarchaeota archaeon]|nr:tryptophanase [Candidatus Heimdallarchaeota archaeon]
MTKLDRRLPPPPFKIKVVEPIKIIPQKERKLSLEAAGYNIFNVASENVYIDLLTDSGTSAMSDFQWAGLLQGDEAYAQCKNFFHLEKVIKEITGYKYVIPTHQGRSAENLICFAYNLNNAKMAVSNQFFDTTKANIETTGAKTLDLVIHEAYDTSLVLDFKGNLDTNALKNTIEKYENIALIVLTITNNTGGGQPVSMKNIAEVSKIAKSNNIPFILDAARFAENAYFIKLREKGYGEKTPRAIAREMFSYADGCMVSAKKDGLVNIGGFIALNDENMFNKIKERMVIIEGFPTYGGLAGRDLEAMARGLEEVLSEDYLEYRYNQLQYLGNSLAEFGIPVLQPIGGHSVNLDALKFLPHIPQSQFPAWALVNTLYERYGIRAVELGSVMFARKENNIWIYPKLELVRLAIPRRVYSQEHLNYVIDSIVDLYQHGSEISGYEITYDPGVLRHFNARFKPIVK